MLPSNNHITEKEFLVEVAAGNQESFKRLFDAYYPKLYNYISTIIKVPQVAEEVAMDVFLKIWLGREMITRIENFDSFLFRVAHNKSIDFLRSAARNPKVRDLLWDEIQLSATEQADTYLLRKEFESKHREAIALLSPQRKKVYQLSREENKNHDQIADHLGLSRNTVNNHIVEAQRFVRTYLLKHLDIASYFLFFVLAK